MACLLWASSAACDSRPPNGWRLSGDGGEADGVRCSRGLSASLLPCRTVCLGFTIRRTPPLLNLGSQPEADRGRADDAGDGREDGRTDCGAPTPAIRHEP